MDLLYWLMLLKAPNLGVKTFYKSLRYFETPQQVFQASHHERLGSGLFKKSTLAYLNSANTSIVKADLEWMQKKNCHILTLIDKRYPPQLKTIADPPPLLYVRGDVGCLKEPQFGALEQSAKTIAVCGTGLDRIYPAKHKSLAHQISMQGALISEFFIGTSPIASNFPRRNRIISALSLGTLVVEASIKSGTMITAKLAAEQGKEVFAIPSSIHNPLSQGCHYLINQGAKLVSNINDIVEELPEVSLSDILPQKKDDSIKGMDKTGSKVLKCLSYEPLSIDQLVEKTNLSPQIVSQELLLLELAGKLEKTHAQGYILIK